MNNSFIGYLIPASLMLLSISCAAAESPGIQCPSHAPQEWHLGRDSVLSGVNILSKPKGEAIDNDALPSLTPDSENVSKDITHEHWKINQDGPEWLYFVDCHYVGTSQFLRLSTIGLTFCNYYHPNYENKKANLSTSKRLVCS